MSWLQVDMSAPPHRVEALEARLTEAGALAVSLSSAGVDELLEPAPGETPLWNQVRLQALFPISTDLGPLRRTLAASGVSVTDTRFVGDQDWQALARSHAVDAVFGARLWLHPRDLQEGELEAPQDGLVELLLDPGLAFGTGAHPTTRLCLEWLACHITSGQQVLDFGCGSGILGLAGALLGARVVAVDHDPQALLATRENAAYNGVDPDRLRVLGLQAWRSQQVSAGPGGTDVVVANILAEPLMSLAPEFEQVTEDGGAIILSGILAEQVEDVMSRYPHTRFAPPVLEQGWACLHGVRAARS